jgi:hypothetical protein
VRVKHKAFQKARETFLCVSDIYDIHFIASVCPEKVPCNRTNPENGHCGTCLVHRGKYVVKTCLSGGLREKVFSDVIVNHLSSFFRGLQFAIFCTTLQRCLCDVHKNLLGGNPV